MVARSLGATSRSNGAAYRAGFIMTDRPETTPANLHAALVAKQSTAELARKQAKAACRGIWTREDLDLARRKADELSAALEKCFE